EGAVGGGGGGVEAGGELEGEGGRRGREGGAVMGQRRIEWRSPRRHFDDEPLEPFGRNEIEQRRRGDEIERTDESEFEVAREIDRRGRDGHVRRMSGRKSPSQKAETVVDQPPALARRKLGPNPPHPPPLAT